MFTTLALFVLKLEMMLLLEIVLTLYRLLLLLSLLLPWFAVLVPVPAENTKVALLLLICLTS